jgi:hypothetical protein
MKTDSMHAAWLECKLSLSLSLYVCMYACVYACVFIKHRRIMKVRPHFSSGVPLKLFAYLISLATC